MAVHGRLGDCCECGGPGPYRVMAERVLKGWAPFVPSGVYTAEVTKIYRRYTTKWEWTVPYLGDFEVIMVREYSRYWNTQTSYAGGNWYDYFKVWTSCDGTIREWSWPDDEPVPTIDTYERVFFTDEPLNPEDDWVYSWCWGDLTGGGRGAQTRYAGVVTAGTPTYTGDSEMVQHYFDGDEEEVVTITHTLSDPYYDTQWAEDIDGLIFFPEYGETYRVWSDESGSSTPFDLFRFGSPDNYSTRKFGGVCDTSDGGTSRLVTARERF
jgi:hypothetical protein